MYDDRQAIEKEPTGIEGLDAITLGGLPKGRPTLIAGAAGSGKTMFGMQFLVHGALEFDEPGVFMAFEEKTDELVANFRSLGIDLEELMEQGKLSLDHVRVERHEFEDTGEYDLEGLFIRLNYAIDSIGAKRVVLDTIETLFGGLPNPAILRAELHRLFGWLRDKGVTAVITGESGDAAITRQGLEEYVSDCVIVLSHRVTEDISTRRLRVVKYRGSAHGTNEYPFLIDESGISVLPITALTLDQEASEERVSSGIPGLDAMVEGGGLYRGTSILVSGTAGTGKSSMGAAFVNAACSRGERALYISFEESEQQLRRNMRSIGMDLGRWVDEGLLTFQSTRSTVFGLEMHLVTIYNLVKECDPSVIVIDPMSSLLSIGTKGEIQATLTRLIDFLKSRGVTAMFTSLVSGSEYLDRTEESVSSLMDTWLLLRNSEYNGERNRTLYLLKSRGMAHSNQVREFLLTDDGIRLEDVYVGQGTVYTGSARAAEEAKEDAERALLMQEIDARQRELGRERALLDARVTELRAEFEARSDETERIIAGLKLKENAYERERESMRLRRQALGSADVGVGAEND
jgi:circadian clock protein KaiC